MLEELHGLAHQAITMVDREIKRKFIRQSEHFSQPITHKFTAQDTKNRDVAAHCQRYSAEQAQLLRDGFGSLHQSTGPMYTEIYLDLTTDECQ